MYSKLSRFHNNVWDWCALPELDLPHVQEENGLDKNVSEIVDFTYLLAKKNLMSLRRKSVGN